MDYGYSIATHSEMSHMFYVTLGNLAYFTTSGAYQDGRLYNTGPFSNVQTDLYWSATEYAPAPSIAWGFRFGDGYQGYSDKAYNLYAWAVRAGDVGASAVPVPAAAWLFGSGLVGGWLVSRGAEWREACGLVGKTREP